MEDAVLYVTAQGSRLTRVGERLTVRDREGRILQDIPFFRVRQVLCHGTVEASHAVLTALLRPNIDLVFLTLDGRLKGRISNLQPRAVECRMKQYEKACDPAFRLAMARSLVRGKLQNARTWLMRQNRNRDQELARQVLGLSNCLDSLAGATTVDELMGLEGMAGKYHFEAFRLILKQDLGFTGRIRRPPTDPVNAMLSFGYTLLFQRVWSAVETAGLDPMLSNLHGIEDRRPSLALDLMEEFRTLIVDVVVAGIVNRIDAVPGDFVRTDGKGVRMTREMLARFVHRFQERLNDQVSHPVSGQSYAYKDILLQQAWQYKSVVTGERETYLPVVTR